MRNPKTYQTILTGDILGDDDPALTQDANLLGTSDNNLFNLHVKSKLDNVWHVMTVADNSDINVLINGLTIQNGFASADQAGASLLDQKGAGIYVGPYVTSINLTLDNVYMKDNVAIQSIISVEHSPQNPSGAAITFNPGLVANNSFAGTLNIQNSIFQNNLAIAQLYTPFLSQGGAIWVGHWGDITALNTTFSHNQAEVGGAVCSNGSNSAGGHSLYFKKGVRFSDNNAFAAGGAISYNPGNYAGLSDPQLIISDSLLENNHANFTFG